MNAVATPAEDNDACGSESDSNSEDLLDHYEPLSTVPGGDSEDEDGGDQSDQDPNPNFHSLQNGWMENGVSSIGLSDEDNVDEKEEEEEATESERAIERAFREDERRRAAPLPAENSVRVMEAMRQISFGGAAPDWAGRVPEDQLIDRLRRLRRPVSASSAALDMDINSMKEKGKTRGKKTSQRNEESEHPPQNIRPTEQSQPPGGHVRAPTGKGKGAQPNYHASLPVWSESHNREKSPVIPVPGFTRVRDENSNKRRRDDTFSSTHLHLKGLYVSEGDLEKGDKSFWNVEDPGLASRMCEGLFSQADLERARGHSDRVILEANYTSAMQGLNATKMVSDRFNEYKKEIASKKKEIDELRAGLKKMEVGFSKKEAENVKLLAKNSKLSKENSKLVKENSRLAERLKRECQTGAMFFQSDDWHAYKAELESDAVDLFKKSKAYEEALMDCAVSFYGEIVGECQNTLRDSSVGEDVIRLLDPPGEDGGLDEDDEVNEDVLAERLKRECQTGAKFFQSYDWHAYKAKLESDAVGRFKKSKAYEEALMDCAVRFYGEIVGECQNTLRASGRVGEDVIRLLDPPGVDYGPDEDEEATPKNR